MKPHRSLFSVIMFCATSSLVAALGLAVLIASVTVTFAISRNLSSRDIEVLASAPEPPHVQTAANDNATLSGVITDDRCGAKHDMGSDKTSSECARACVRDGSNYALVDGDKSYRLDGNNEEIARFAGQRAQVRGSLIGKTIKASSITAQ